MEEREQGSNPSSLCFLLILFNRFAFQYTPNACECSECQLPGFVQSLELLYLFLASPHPHLQLNSAWNMHARACVCVCMCVFVCVCLLCCSLLLPSIGLDIIISVPTFCMCSSLLYALMAIVMGKLYDQLYWVVKPLLEFSSISMENGESRINYKKSDVNGADTEVLNYLNAQQLPRNLFIRKLIFNTSKVSHVLIILDSIAAKVKRFTEEEGWFYSISHMLFLFETLFLNGHIH